MTPDPKTYTTQELKRLLTLSFMTCHTGEFGIANASGVVMLRGTDDYIVRRDGYISVGGSDQSVRRVISFDDTTERDPSRADMQRELDRRKAMATAASRFSPGQRVCFKDNTSTVWIVKGVTTRGPGETSVIIQEEHGVRECVVDPGDLTTNHYRFVVGRTLVYTGTTKWNNVTAGHLATATKSCTVDDEYVVVAWDQRVKAVQCDGSYRASQFRLATAADIAAYEARVAPPISNATHAGRRVRRTDGLSGSPDRYAGRVLNARLKSKFTDSDTVVVYLLDADGMVTWCPGRCLELIP